MKLFNFSADPRTVREKAGLNQQEFWTKIGVTQSGGSRYESGRQMPKPVRELLRLVHVEKLDLSKVRKEDFEVIEYLKSEHPELYRNLRKALKGRGRRRDGAELSD
jgi:transcriptional regulator with XRE-family HTH domain